MSLAYKDFIATKAARAPMVGFEPDRSRFPTSMKAFQSALTDLSLKRGRNALFEGTGLGKTIQELTWAREVVAETRRPVLHLSPLAVAEQTVLEAQKFNIDGVAYAADQDKAKTPIVVTNYDRAHLFDFSQFGGVVLDESSILKAHDGKTRARLTEACATVPYRLPATATPAPNDWTEIGQHAEFLGVMSAKEMLSMYFVHDGSIRANGGRDGWRLKRHAEHDFWAWVASWAVMIRHPRDLGFDEPGYDLPPLRKHLLMVQPEGRPLEGELFHRPARTLPEQLAAKRQSLPQRVGVVSEIVRAAPDRPWLLWCHLNDEADALVRAIPGAVQISGADSREDKVAKMLAYARGEIKDLVTKPSIAGFGMNWQHCRSMAFVGLNNSFEQVYQAIRRCWRFGQNEAVDAYFAASELEGQVLANQNEKEREYEAMSAAMVDHMRDLTRAAIGQAPTRSAPQLANRTMEMPPWLQ